jgi:hypothetical protein
MIAALTLSLLLGQAAPAPGAAPTPAPAPTTTLAAPTSAEAAHTPLSEVVVVVKAPAEAPEDPAAIAANLAQTYEQSCGGRIYGMYAAMCNNLADRLKDAQAQARKAKRSRTPPLR